MPKGFRQTWSKFVKGACQAVQKAKLLKARLNNTTAAEKAQKACQKQFGKVLQTEGILYAEDAQRMVCNWLESEKKKEKKQDKDCDKWYTTALQKCYKQTKKW